MDDEIKDPNLDDDETGAALPVDPAAGDAAADDAEDDDEDEDEEEEEADAAV